MSSKKIFTELKKGLERYESKRENIILLTRSIVRNSKQAIYSVLAGRHIEANKQIYEISKEYRKLRKQVQSEPLLAQEGSYKVAAQEYCEAVLLYDYETGRKLSGHKELDVEPEHYILGICDLTGELHRLAVNSAIKGNYPRMEKIRDFVSDVYLELMKFDLRNGEARRKFDGIKYDLKKMENVLVQAKIFGRC